MMDTSTISQSDRKKLVLQVLTLPYAESDMSQLDKNYRGVYDLKRALSSFILNDEKRLSIEKLIYKIEKMSIHPHDPFNGPQQMVDLLDGLCLEYNPIDVLMFKRSEDKEYMTVKDISKIIFTPNIPLHYVGALNP